MEILKVQNLCKTYGTGEAKVDALKNVSFSLEKGEFVAVVGESGSGKSTLLNCIGALDVPTSGTVTMDGNNLFSMKEEERTIFRRRNIGFIFQSFQLVSELTVEQNIAFPLLLDYRKPKASDVEEILELLGLTERRNHLPSQLSGGQQQRVALARMMIGEPEVILLDEPFSALDGYLKDILQRDMQNFLKDYKGDMIMVTHSRDEAYKFCSQLTLLNNGKDILTGETRDIFENPQYLEAARLTGCKNFSAVQKMGSHEVYALDWELMLRSEQEVTEDITHVGIRGHWMRPATKAGENTMEVQVEEYIENTFEHQYLFRNKGAAESGTLWWMCQKKNFQETAKDNIPKYLYFPPEHVMLLKK